MPASFLPSRSSIDERARIVQQRIDSGVDVALFGMVAAIIEGIEEAAYEATSRTSQRFLDFADFLGGPQSAPQRLQANETLGRAAHESILRSYRAHRRGAEYAVPSPTRVAPGALGKALADRTNIYEATADSIFLVNEVGLSRDALQWARLNFGAGARGHGAVGAFQVRFSDLVVAEFGLNESARPAFSIPRGYFWDGESIVATGDRGQHPFYPAGVGPAGAGGLVAGRHHGRFTGRDATSRQVDMSIGRRMITQGITGWNFLDKGVETLANQFGPVYTRMFQDTFHNSLRVGGRTFDTVVVRPHARFV